MATEMFVSAEEARRRAEARKWDQFRTDYPVRFQFAAGDLQQRPFGRPGKVDQRDWTIYTTFQDAHPTKIQQQHLVVPLLIQPTQLIAGVLTPSLFGQDLLGGELNPTEPYRYEGSEHATDIARVEELLKRHPEVSRDKVKRIDVKKAKDQRIFGLDGRATKGHQAPYNLQCSLAAGGAIMEFGVTVYDTKANSVSIWWRPR